MSDWDDIKKAGNAASRTAGAGAGAVVGWNVTAAPAAAALAIPVIGIPLAGLISIGGAVLGAAVGAVAPGLAIGASFRK